MTVGKLVEILKQCDPNLPVATHANNHTYMSGDDEQSHGPLRVCLTASGHVVIGNLYRKAAAGATVSQILDGGPPLSGM
jgi:hypothetical protein